MASPPTGNTGPLEPPAAEFSSLRREGIRQLGRLAGSQWTDFNTHDPGITILEQLCYALTDLDYRTRFDLPDLLARDGEDPYASLFGPARILPSGPVTLTDLRKLVIDVSGVKNAWVELVDEPFATHDAGRKEVSHLATTNPGSGTATFSPNVSEVHVRGLYRVLIEKSDLTSRGGSEIRQEVARRLHRFRGLGEDFQSIEIFKQQDVRLRATLEIAAVPDATALLAEVYQAVAAEVSPGLPFHTLAEMLERGWRVDQVFEGPLLDHGFIDAQELAHTGRRTSVRISDLLHAAMRVPGVVAVKNLRFLGSDGRPTKDWLLEIDADKTARLDLQNSDIRLERRDLRLDQGLQKSARARYYKLAREAARPASTGVEKDLRLRHGRDRDVANYHCVQQQFPMMYGVGAAGLSRSAPRERRAQARQLQAYLMFYEQLLANQFAQLANVGRLFSFHDETPDSYFSQAVQDEDGTLGLDAVREPDPQGHELQRITEGSAEAGARRRNRFLDHLLARFGEQFHDYGLFTSGETASDEAELAGDKRAFLRDYPSISRGRGTAFDYLAPPGEDNISGLELTLRRKLGVRDDEARFHVVEHILLRPIDADANQTGPLFGAAGARDPYSLQISFVFPDWPARYQDASFRQFVEQTVRDETPAHLTAYVLWKTKPEMKAFEAAHAAWMKRWREHRLAELGL